MPDVFEALLTLPIAKAFAKYLCSKDFINADFVLVDGMYHIQDMETLEIIDTNKDNFIKWIEGRITSSADSASLTYKLSLTPNNEVMLTFNMEYFPYLVKSPNDYLLGLNIRSDGKKITSITTIETEFYNLGGEDNLSVFWKKAFPDVPYVYSKAIDWYFNSIPSKKSIYC